AIAEQGAQERQVTQDGDLVLGLVLVLGDQAADGNGFAVGRLDGGIHLLDVEDRAQDAVTQVFLVWRHRGDRRRHTHEDRTIRADAWRNRKVHTDDDALDVLLGDASGGQRGARQVRNLLTDVDGRRLVVQRHHLRAAQDVHPTL